MQTRQKLVNWAVALGFIAFWFIWSHYNKKNPNDYRYTIATVTSVEGVLDGGPIANILYFVNDVKYKGSVSMQQGNIKLYRGDRIYFMYLIANPEYGEAVSEKLVPDTLKVIPPNGWKNLP